MRYVRLYANCVRFSLSRAMEFRVDFFFRVVMDALFYAASLAFFLLLYRHTPMLGGLDRDQMYVFVGAVFVADAIYMTLFSNNLWMLPYLINRGDLDYYLTRPVSSLFFLSVRDFAFNSFLNLLMAVAFLGWALARYPLDLGWFAMTRFVVMLLAGCFLNYILSVFFVLPVFWMHRGEGIRQVFFALHLFIERPLEIFKGWTRRALISVLPLGLIVSVPTYVLFRGLDTATTIRFIAIVGIAFALMVWAWDRALRSYSSASS